MEEGSRHRLTTGALLLHKDQARLFSLLHLPHSLLPTICSPFFWFGTSYSVREYSYIPFEVWLIIILFSAPLILLGCGGDAVLQNQVELRASS